MFQNINYPATYHLAREIEMQKMKCTICGWIYDPVAGVPNADVAPGTSWEDVDAEFRCPECGAVKKWFQPVDE